MCFPFVAKGIRQFFARIGSIGGAGGGGGGWYGSRNNWWGGQPRQYSGNIQTTHLAPITPRNNSNIIFVVLILVILLVFVLGIGTHELGYF